MALVPLTHAERCLRFGTFTWVAKPMVDNPERVVIDAAWEEAHIETVRVPQLGKRVRVHREIVPPFLALFEAWEKAKLLTRILSFDGTYVPRFKRFSGTLDQRFARARAATDADLSNHAWGTAMDLNAHWNRRGYPACPEGLTGTLLPLVELAEDHGFAWGGRWHVVDAMHFEYVGAPPPPPVSPENV